METVKPGLVVFRKLQSDAVKPEREREILIFIYIYIYRGPQWKIGVTKI